jgi:hypothetical protein
MASFFLPQATNRENFIAGWERNVAGMFGGPPPDVFWNPRAGQWQTYAPDKWSFLDEDLPRSPRKGESSDGGDVFDEITAQWTALPLAQHQVAVWNPREFRLVLAEPKQGTGNCRQHYEDVLAYLNQLHAAGQLDDAQLAQQSEELWKQYQYCL